MMLRTITREEVREFVNSCVEKHEVSRVVANRLMKIMDRFSNVTSFLESSNVQLLMTARSMGKSQEKDFGKRTYSFHNRIHTYFKEKLFEEKKNEEMKQKLIEQQKAEEARKNPTFTQKQIEGIGAFMKLTGATSVDLAKIRMVFDCFSFDPVN